MKKFLVLLMLATPLESQAETAWIDTLGPVGQGVAYLVIGLGTVAAAASAPIMLPVMLIVDDVEESADENEVEDAIRRAIPRAQEVCALGSRNKKPSWSWLRDYDARRAAERVCLVNFWGTDAKCENVTLNGYEGACRIAALATSAEKGWEVEVIKGPYLEDSRSQALAD